MASLLTRALVCTLSLSACLALDRSESDPPPDGIDAGERAPTAADAGQTSARLPLVHGECWIGLRGSELEARDGETLDTCIANFADPECSYRVEYGQDVADPFAHSAPDQVELIAIDEGSARAVSVPERLNSDAYLTGLFVASFPQDGPEYALSATARCRSEASLAHARAVLETVDVPHVGEGLCAPVVARKCTIQ